MKHVHKSLTNPTPTPTRQQQADSVKRGATFKGPPGGRVSLLALAIQHAMS
jgi:hypothetical protein